MGMVNQWELSYQEAFIPTRLFDCRYVKGTFSDGNDIKLGKEEIWDWTSAPSDECVEAMKILDNLWMDKDLGKPGRRNKDAVNLCVALHVLGCREPIVWLAQLKDYHVISNADLWALSKHVDRVSPYLIRWGKEDDMGTALYYILD